MPGGDVIGRQGEPAHALIVVTKGAVALTHRSPSGHSSVVGFRYPGELVMPQRQLFQWPVTTTALCASSTCQIRFEELSELSEHGREFTDLLFDVAAMQMAESYQHAALLTHKEVDQRLAWFLLDFAARNHGRQTPRQGLELPMTRSVIADYIGIRTETVCRALARLKASRLIALVNRRRLHILDRRALTDLAKAGRPGAARTA